MLVSAATTVLRRIAVVKEAFGLIILLIQGALTERADVTGRLCFVGR